MNDERHEEKLRADEGRDGRESLPERSDRPGVAGEGRRRSGAATASSEAPEESTSGQAGLSRASSVQVEPSREHESEVGGMDEDELRSLLGAALSVDREPAPDVLKGVQRRIRQRSRGKFYADGWSTGGGSRSTYYVTSVLMLLVLLGMYLALRPWW